MLTAADVTHATTNIQLRRGSDNVLQDFYAVGFNTGELNTAASGSGSSLATWVGTAAAYVHTWYDQYGGRAATQTNATLQPLLASASGWTGAPVVRFQGTHTMADGPLVSLFFDGSV